MKKTTSMLLCLLLCFVMACCPLAHANETLSGENEEFEYEEVFAQWNEGAPALNALIDYVESVTDESSPDYIPPESRVAVFDMDGTLYGELFPTYVEYYMFLCRALNDPTMPPNEEITEFARKLRDEILDNNVGSEMPLECGIMAAKAYAGMTLNEFADFVTEILLRDVDGFEGMTYGEAFYQPMLEVIDYLNDNDFKVYVCSGTDRYICRILLEGSADVETEHIIGADVALKASGQGDADGLDYVFDQKDELVRSDELLIKNLKTNKVTAVQKEVGMVPVLSFGNSGGDVSIHNFTLSNDQYKSAAFMLVADDEERDYGNTEKGQELAKKWQESGYNVISMKDDFKTIYGEGVKKTGSFRFAEEFADKTEETGDFQYVVYLGTNDKDTNEPVGTTDDMKEKVKDILIRRFGGYTLQEAYGGWIGDDGKEYREYTILIQLSDTTEEDVHDLCQELLKEFHQSSILVQRNPTKTDFITLAS